MVHHCGWRILVGLLVVPALLVNVMAQEFGETIVKRGAVVEGDLYLAGRTVEIATEVQGDLIAAGQSVNVTRPVTEDVMVAAETVSLSGPVADDVRAAGRHVSLSAPVGGHVLAAGEQVTLSVDASTGSWAWLAGRLVQVLGKVGGDLRAAGQEVVIGGTVLGDVKVYAERIRVLETAHIQGRLEYGSERELEIADGAVIEGDIKRMPLPDFEREAKTVVGAAMGAIVLFAFGLLVVGIFYVSAFPGLAAVAAQTATRRPWASLGMGIAILAGVPFVALMLIATGIGLLLAMAILALYAVTLLIGYINGIAWLGDLALRRWRKATAPSRLAKLLAFTLVLVVVMVLQLVPLFGQLAALVIWLFGIGGLSLGTFQYYRAASVPVVS